MHKDSLKEGDESSKSNNSLEKKKIQKRKRIREKRRRSLIKIYQRAKRRRRCIFCYFLGENPSPKNPFGDSRWIEPAKQ